MMKCNVPPDYRTIANLTEDKAHLREDAERYRWLRDYDAVMMVYDIFNDEDSTGELAKQKLDEYIDAARTK
jgi:hypothetical protein